MLYFRCYNCWTSLKFEQERGIDYIECPDCGTTLYVGKDSSRKLAERALANKNPEEHQEILDTLLKDLEERDNIVKGDVEIIAGPETIHKPDAIFYYIDDEEELLPLIYEVETCGSLGDKHTISQCRLFGHTAEKTQGNFYFVLPKICITNGKKVSGWVLAREMLRENDISYDGILTY